MKVGAIILALVMLSGCAILKDQVTKSAEATAEAVTFYCVNFTQDQRQEYGDQVRALADPHAIRVTCEGDE